MYEYKKSQCLPRGYGNMWSTPDLSLQPLDAVYAAYSQIYLVLFHPLLNREVIVDMNLLRLEFSSYTGTILSWLVNIGNRNLPESSKLPDAAIKYVNYSNAVQAGYRLNLVNRGHINEPDYPVELLTDLQLTRPGHSTDLSLLHTHCLISINGLIHNTDTDGTNAYVVDAGKVLHKVGSSHTGIISFLDVGKLTKVKLSIDSIGRLEADTPLSKKAIFTVDTPLDNQSYIMIVGGYMVQPGEGLFWRIGENSFAICLERLFYMERYLETKNIIDLSSMELPVSDVNPDVTTMEALWSDDAIKKYLTLSQSFLVVVDTPLLSYNKIHVRNSPLPGKFTSYQDPTYPLIVGYGRTAEYWKTEEAAYWSLSVPDGFYRRFIASQQDKSFMKMVSSHLTTQDPTVNSRGHLLEIAGIPNT